MKKKLLLSALLTLSAVVLVVATVLTTIAFLAHQASVTNTFTMGNIMINLYESSVDKDGNKIADDPNLHGDMKDSIGNTYQLSPNGSYDKDPTVYVMPKSDDCIVFVQVQNGIRHVESATDATYTCMYDQMEAKGWNFIGSNALGNVYVYNGEYPDATYPTDKEGLVISNSEEIQSFDMFTNFKIKNNASREAVDGKTLSVNAYAIQKASFTRNDYLTRTEVEAAWNALVANFDTALEITSTTPIS